MHDPAEVGSLIHHHHPLLDPKRWRRGLISGEDRLEDGEEIHSSRLDILRNRNFRLLWVGQAVSLIGDQFYLIALPWLVLILTGDPLALGLVLALTAVPRALFMLVGGALTDRFSPRMLMILSNSMRLMVVVIMTSLVLTASIETWMLYIFALTFGLADAMFYPAQFSILPQMVERWQLKAANSLVQAATQVSLFLGPVLAGVVIAIFGGSSEDLSGIGIAFSLDAITFLVSLLTLFLIRIEREPEREEIDFLSSIKQGLSFIIRSPGLRIMFLILAMTNLLVAGPFDVGIPVLADSRLPGGAAAFGILMSAFGGGSLIGITVAGMLPEPRIGRFGYIMVLIIILFGIGTAGFAFADSIYTAGAITFSMGLMIGYVDILIITWVQHGTPMNLMGRMMGMMMFSSAGLLPISLAISGAALRWSMEGLFLIAGILMVVMGVLLTLMPSIRSIGW
jgi:hypothetical protein